MGKRLTIWIVICVLLGVWAYARFGGDTETQPPPPTIGQFAAPEFFAAKPGLNARRINVRAGPGTEYRILETHDQGTILTGVARVADTRGAFWIELANGRGFVKETVITPANGTDVP